VKTLLISLLSIFLGLTLWAFSLQLTGAIEPWDAKNIFIYIGILFGIGFSCSLLAGPARRKLFWLWPICTILGQVLYLLIFMKAGPAVILATLFLVIFGLSSFLGSGVPAIGFWWRRKRLYSKQHALPERADQ